MTLTKNEKAIAAGAIAGGVAANGMTMLRMLARRFGWIDKSVPQVMEEWATEALDLPDLAQHALDQVLHVGYAMGLGAVDGYLYEKKFENTWLRGLSVGAATWAAASFVILPALKVSRGAWASNKKENGVNLAAHLLFGLGTAFMTEEIFHQRKRGRGGRAARMLSRVG